MAEMKTGLVDVGGGMRDIYGAGVLDYCMDNAIRFDMCFGVSAGSANVSSYISGQKGRNYQFYTEYAFRRQYMSISNWVRTRNFLDLDYIYGVLSNSDGENPMNYDAFVNNPAGFMVVVTHALTGKPEYFDKSDMKKDQYDPIKASSCVPVVNNPYYINDIPYFDGGLSDPIPFRKCMETGCEKVVIILTRPKDYRRHSEDDRMTVKLLKNKYPMAAKAVAKRAQTYNAQLEEALELEKQGKVLIVAPDDILEMKTLTKDRDKMIQLYRKGLKDAEKIPAFLES